MIYMQHDLLVDWCYTCLWRKVKETAPYKKEYEDQININRQYL